MVIYADFQEAVHAWRKSGGAMNFYDGIWQVGTAIEVAESTGHSARYCTEHALFEGGMSDDQVRHEMADFEDEFLADVYANDGKRRYLVVTKLDGNTTVRTFESPAEATEGMLSGVTYTYKLWTDLRAEGELGLDREKWPVRLRQLFEYECECIETRLPGEESEYHSYEEAPTRYALAQLYTWIRNAWSYLATVECAIEDLATGDVPEYADYLRAKMREMGDLPDTEQET